MLFQFKDKFFQEEDEWRLRKNYYIRQVHQESELLHRSAKGKLIPYIELSLQCEEPIALDPIVHIMRGPKNTTEEHIIKNLLQSNGFDPDIEITSSKGSYQ